MTLLHRTPGDAGCEFSGAWAPIPGLNKKAQDTVSFPSKFVGGAMLLTVLVVAWMGWVILEGSRFVELAKTHFLALERLHGEILQYDEVLTMSARMAAATGEKSWIDRYLLYEPLLDGAITEAINLSQNNDMVEAARETDVANVKLIEMEHRSFVLIEEGFVKEAQALLSSDAYEQQKIVYAEGMRNLLKLLHDTIEIRTSNQTDKSVLSIGVAFSFLCITLIIWISVYRRVSQWRTMLSVMINERKRAEVALLEAHETLEVRVQERTTALKNANVDLKSEVAERKRAEEALHVAVTEAEIANRAKSEFLANMSHELRTPLNAIIGFSEIIKDETFGPVGSTKYRDYSQDIHESGLHLLNLINDILDLSKIESGTEKLHEDKIDIPGIIRSAFMLVRHRAEQGEIKFELEVSDQLPALRADEHKLKQILTNLLSNAIKFTDAGGTVTLRAWCRADSGFVFQIIDTGIGIAPEDIPKALSRFGQVDASLSRSYEGTGLGLPLAKALVGLHGGTLELQSKVGIGTTVTVRFPAERAIASLDNAASLDVEDRAAR